MYKRLICFIMSIMLVFMTVGCNNPMEEELSNEEVIVEEEVNVDKLREEYYEMLDIMDQVLRTMDNPSPSQLTDASQLMDVIDILSNRQKPTQQLTIELDELVSQFISVGFDHYTTMNESKKLDLEQELLELFQQIEEKALEIELIINEEEV